MKYIPMAYPLTCWPSPDAWRHAYSLRYLGHRSPLRSKYVPGGPNRNCGDRGISPKKLRDA